MTTKRGVVLVAFAAAGKAYSVGDEIENPDAQWVKAGWVEVTKATKRTRRTRKTKTDG